MLELENVRVSYGPVEALKDVSLKVPEGGIVALLGGNGAGKTTTLRAISGLLRLTAGTITFDGQRIDAMSPTRIVRLGISQVPEGRQIFPELTVYENLLMGAYTQSSPTAIREDMDRVISHFPILGQRSRQIGNTLSGGEQQMLAIARALMSQPRLLLLDEPSLGLAPLVVREIFRILRSINQGGTWILLVEQNARMALSLASYAYVLETGSTVIAGDSRELMQNSRVRQAYLGG